MQTIIRIINVTSDQDLIVEKVLRRKDNRQSVYEIKNQFGSRNILLVENELSSLAWQWLKYNGELNTIRTLAIRGEQADKVKIEGRRHIATEGKAVLKQLTKNGVNW